MSWTCLSRSRAHILRDDTDELESRVASLETEVEALRESESEQADESKPSPEYLSRSVDCSSALRP
jgi:hypothetical protein